MKTLYTVYSGETCLYVGMTDDFDRTVNYFFWGYQNKNNRLHNRKLFQYITNELEGDTSRVQIKKHSDIQCEIKERYFDEKSRLIAKLSPLCNHKPGMLRRR